MEILHRKLLLGIVVGTISSYNCTNYKNCDESSVIRYCSICDHIYPPPSPLPPSPPVRHNSAQNLVIPYLISVLCALGVAFIILTACTILLRYRRSRRRNSRRVSSSREVVSVDEDHGPVDHPVWWIVTVGLQQSVIDSITPVKYKKCDGLIEETHCSVCLTEFEEGDDLRLLPKCSHAFHLPCIDTWLRSHKNCPLCRAPVVNDTSPVNYTALSPNSTSPDSSEPSRMVNSENNGGPVALSDLGSRVLSYLDENHRVSSEDFQPVRRSITLDASAANNAVVVNVAKLTGEGSSEQEKITEVEDAAKRGRRGSSMSRLIKSSSIGRSLQKSPVSVKRSFSSSAKIFSSFRGSKSQDSSILPL